MKKILVATNEFFPFKGGIGRYSEEIVVQAKERYDVTVLCPDYGGKVYGCPYEEDIRLITFPGGQFSLRQAPCLLKTILSIDFSFYDYVLVADWPIWLLICLVNQYVPLKKKISFSLMLHGSEILNLKYGKTSLVRKITNPFKDVQHIFVNSEYTKSILLKYFGDKLSCDVHVTYLAAKNQRLNTIKEIPEKKHGSFILLTVGRLDSRKGHETVIDSIARLSAERGKILYRIIGNGSDDYRQYLLEKAKRLDVNIEILSDLSDSDVELEYLKANIFILAARPEPLKVEGFGIVFLEAAAFGLPSISTKVGAIPEVVTDHVTGLLCEHDINDISKAIKTVFHNRNLIKKFSENCLLRFDFFSWRKTASQTFRVMSQEAN
ncbi:glycosyltransferase family 4 protein [Gynuella sunshinyii]|uniref:Glycosyltransferase n=1 Tax=Gynuella sunshinyii YC6258 TaxID=1445510 RepID=A0A0C5VKU6_9GAMM|nr:glycosyltransferase family 4 protein [Gynuella sunshinyii]AJQ95287.1 glycosyltransferase [Gynuella sunshinyii YC6258]